MAKTNKLQETAIESWADFVTACSPLNKKTGASSRYVFRGQSDSSWSLSSAFARENHSSTRSALQLELEMQRLFRVDAHNYLKPPVLPRHTNELRLWWSAMQHYGVPTRLLDWTSSPYVAAYFATSGFSRCNSADWICHPNSINTANGVEHSVKNSDTNTFIIEEESDYIEFFDPAIKTKRMLAQQGCFSICANPLKDHAEAITTCIKGDNQNVVFEKLIIPSKLNTEFMQQLNAMNITARSLFPGLDGLGRSISEFLKLTIREIS